MYLVTGGGGFFGAHLVRAGAAWHPRARARQWPLRQTHRLADVPNHVEWREGDVHDPEAVARACQGVEVVLHHVAVASVTKSVADPAMTHATNVTGGATCAQAYWSGEGNPTHVFLSDPLPDRNFPTGQTPFHADMTHANNAQMASVSGDTYFVYAGALKSDPQRGCS